MTPPTRTDTGPSFLRLVAVELRKATGTLAGRLLLLALLGIGVVGLVLEVLFAGDGVPAVFTGYAETAMFAQLLLPVVGVLMLTAEWTQRTALTTFTLVPRRGRVLAATLAAAVVLAVATVLVLAGLSAVTTLVAGGVNGVDVVWDDAGPAAAGHLVGAVLDVLLGARPSCPAAAGRPRAGHRPARAGRVVHGGSAAARGVRGLAGHLLGLQHAVGTLPR